MKHYMPCRYCGLDNLSLNEWSLDGGEVEAVECNNCLSGAIKTTWNEPVIYRGLTIALSDRQAPHGSYDWFDADHDPSPVERDDAFIQGPGQQQVSSVQLCMIEIDIHLLEHAA